MICTYLLDDIWPHVVDKIDAIRQRHQQSWTLDDVYQACKDQRAILISNTEDDSFAVVKVKIVSGMIPELNEQVLFVWIAYGVNGQRTRNLAFLKEIAKQAGCSRMEMESRRRGFERMPGWKRHMMTTYTLEV